MTAGKRIKEIRELYGITQKELGNECGIDPATIRKYETGKLNPKPATIEKIAKGLDIDPSILTESELDTTKAMIRLFSVYNSYDGVLKDGEEIKREIEADIFDDSTIYISFTALSAFLYSWHRVYRRYIDEINRIEELQTINDTEKAELKTRALKNYQLWMSRYPDSEPQKEIFELINKSEKA